MLQLPLKRLRFNQSSPFKSNNKKFRNDIVTERLSRQDKDIMELNQDPIGVKTDNPTKERGEDGSQLRENEQAGEKQEMTGRETTAPLADVVTQLSALLTRTKISDGAEATIALFDGTYSATQFFQAFDRKMEDASMGEQEKLLRLPNYLVRQPLELFKKLRMADRSYFQVRQILLDLYPESSEASFAKYFAMKLTGQTNLETYYREKTAMGLQLGLPQEVILETLTEELPFNDQRLVRVVPPENLGEWSRLVQRIHGPSVPTTRPREDQPPTMSGPYHNTPRRPGAWNAPLPPSNCKFCGARHWHSECRHRPVPATHEKWLKTIKNPSGRLFRWSLRLSSYEYEVRYIKGKLQYEADLLSRNPFCGFLDTTLIKTHQPPPSKESSLTIDHNGLHTVSRKGVTKIIIPKPLIQQLLQTVHTQYNHPGISQMSRIISTQYYWQGMSKDIKQKVKTCPTCQLTKRPLGPTYGELSQPPEAKEPFDLLSLDTIAGFAKYGNTKIYLHVVVDHFSRYAWTFPSKSTSIITYQQVLKRVLQDGSPKRLLTDRAPAFTSPKFRSFLLNRNIHPLLTTSNNPQANGLCERLNATLTGKLRLLHLENPKIAWTKLVKRVTIIYNKTPHSTTGFPPIYLMFGILPPELSDHSTPYPDIDKARKIAHTRTQNKHLQDKNIYDQRHKQPHFEVGDLVLVKLYHHPNTGKLAPYFTGPHTILEIISPNVVHIDRPNQPLQRDTDTIHVNKLKLYTEKIRYISPPAVSTYHIKHNPNYTFPFKHLTPELFPTESLRLTFNQVKYKVVTCIFFLLIPSARGTSHDDHGMSSSASPGSSGSAGQEPGRPSIPAPTGGRISSENGNQKILKENSENRVYANPPAGVKDVNLAAARDVTLNLPAGTSSNGAARVLGSWADCIEDLSPGAEDDFTVVKTKKRRRESSNSPTAAAPSSNSGGARSSRRLHSSARSVPRAQEIPTTRTHITEARARQASSSEEHCVYLEHGPELQPFHYLRALDRLLGGTAGIIQISKVNGHQLLGLANRGLAERLINNGLEVEGTLLRAFPFRKRAERITVSNLPFFVEDSAIINALRPFGRITSIAPKMMKAGPYTYTDGRREAFIVLHEGMTTERLPTRLDITIKGMAWPAYLSTGIKCSRCHGQGHRRANCPLLAGLANNTRTAPPTTPAGVPPPTTPAPPQRSAAQPPAPTPSNPAMEVCSAPPVARAALHSSAPRPSPPAAPAFPMEETPPAPPPVTPAPSLQTPGSREPAAPTPDVEMSIVEETLASFTSSAKNATRVDLDAFIEGHPSVSFAKTDALGLGREEVLDLFSSRTKAQRKGPLLSPPQCDALVGLIGQILDLRPGAASNLYKVLGQVKAELRTTPAVPPTPTLPAPWPSKPTPPALHGEKTSPDIATPPPPLSTEFIDACYDQANDIIYELSDERYSEPLSDIGVTEGDIVEAIIFPDDREPLLRRLSTQKRTTLAGIVSAASERARSSDPFVREGLRILSEMLPPPPPPNLMQILPRRSTSLAAIPTSNAAAQVRRNWADITEEVNPGAEEGFTLAQGRKRRRGSGNSPTTAAPSSNAGASRTIRRPQSSAGSVPRAQEIRATRAHIADARARQASSSEEHCVYIEHSPELEPFHYLRALDRKLGGTAGVIQITKVNGHQLLGLTNRGLAERLISEGLEVEGTLLRAFPFRKRAEMITVGNLPFFVADSAVITALSPYGRVTSIAPKQMKAGPYVYVDGRRDVLITLHEGITIERLPTRLNIKGQAWPAYLSSGIRCSRCHGQGHRRAICPLLTGLANNTRMAPPTTSAGVPPPTTSAPPQRSAAQPPAPAPSNLAMEVCSAPSMARAVLHPSAPRPSPPAAPALPMEETPSAPPPVIPAPSLQAPEGSVSPRSANSQHPEPPPARPDFVAPRDPLPAQKTLGPAAPTPDVEMSIVEETSASSTSLAKNATRVDLDAFIERHPSVSFAGTDALGLGREEVLDLLSSRTKAQRKGPLLSPPQCDALAGLIGQILDLRPGAASNLYKVLGQVKAELRPTPAAVPTPPPPAPRPAEPTSPALHGGRTSPDIATPPPPLSTQFIDACYDQAGDIIFALSRERFSEPLSNIGVTEGDIVEAIIFPEDREPLLRSLSTQKRTTLAGIVSAASERARNSDPFVREGLRILSEMLPPLIYVNLAAARDDVTLSLPAGSSSNGAARVLGNWADCIEDSGPGADNDFTVVKTKKMRRESSNSPTAAAPSSNIGGARSSRRTQSSARSVPRAQEIPTTRAHIAEARARQASSAEEHCVYLEHGPELQPFHYMRALDRLLGGTAGVIQVSKVNGHQLLGLANRGLAERLINNGLEVEGTLLRAFPFRKRAERITVGNLPFFVEDSAIIKALGPYGRITSIAPKMMKAGPYTYTDGRREAFIVLHEGVTNERLPTRLNITIKGEAWPAYLSSGIKCSRCHGQGHHRANCPLLAGRTTAPGPATPASPNSVPPATAPRLPQQPSAQPPPPASPSPTMEVSDVPPTSRAALHPPAALRQPPPAPSALPAEDAPPAPPPVTPAPSLRTPGSREPAAPTPDVEMSIVEETSASSTSSAKNATRIDLDAFIERHPSVSFAETDALGLGREEVLDLLSSRTKAQRNGPLLPHPQCDALAGLIRQILDLRPGAASNLYKVLGQVKAELRTTPAAVPTPPPPAPRPAETTSPALLGERTSPDIATPPPPLSTQFIDACYDQAGDIIFALSRERFSEPLSNIGVTEGDIVEAIIFPEDREPLFRRLSTQKRTTLAEIISAASERARNSDPF
ncbi:hypothetical protein LAZ67_8001604, partial [Cordylochernes scorpioides]